MGFRSNSMPCLLSASQEAGQFTVQTVFHFCPTTWSAPQLSPQLHSLPNSPWPSFYHGNISLFCCWLLFFNFFYAKDTWDYPTLSSNVRKTSVTGCQLAITFFSVSILLNSFSFKVLPPRSGQGSQGRWKYFRVHGQFQPRRQTTGCFEDCSQSVEAVE